MGVDLRITVNDAESAALTGAWSALQVSLGVGGEQDHATLTLAAAQPVTLPDQGEVFGMSPARSAVLRFVADGADLGAFAARAMSGSTKDGTISIECAAVDPTAALRKPRDRTWEGQSINAIVGTIAADANLTPAVHPEIGQVFITARPQIAVSDMAFLQRLIERHQGRLLIQEGRLIVSKGDDIAIPLPTLRVDVTRTGAWLDWRRSWSETIHRIEATFVGDDGVTVETVTVGSAGTIRRLPTTYATRAEAEAAALSHLMAGDVSRDFIEVPTGFVPTAQVLQPLELIGDEIPIGFPALVIHAVGHSLGRSVASTVLTARPAASRREVEVSVA